MAGDGGLPEGVCIPRTPGRTFGPCSAGRLAAGGHPSLPGAPGVLFPINVLCYDAYGIRISRRCQVRLFRRGTVDAGLPGPADTGSSRHIAPHPYVFSAVYDIDGLKSGAHHQMPQGGTVHEGAFTDFPGNLPPQMAGGPPIGLMEIRRCGGQHLCQQSG